MTEYIMSANALLVNVLTVIGTNMGMFGHVQGLYALAIINACSSRPLPEQHTQHTTHNT